jgi:hypothetical protein
MEEKLFDPVKKIDFPEHKSYSGRNYLESMFKKELKHTKFSRK